LASELSLQESASEALDKIEVVDGPASLLLAAAVTDGVADWPTLFGQLELCDCEHCESVYGPAAYLGTLRPVWRRSNLALNRLRTPLEEVEHGR
jgi:hypothetical protein